MGNIYLHDLNINSHLKQRKNLKIFLQFIFENEKKSLQRIDIIFCTDDYLLALNQQFLQHNYYTDTLSFLSSGSGDPIIGEVFISIERIKANSRRLQILYKEELLRVIIHSCLHLCGYLDKPRVEYLKMEKRQELYLKKWNVSRETQIGG